MIPLGPVVARKRMRAARAGVWTYLSDPARRAEWWPELQLDPRVGGDVAERWSEGTGEETVSRDAAGRVDVWVEGHAIGFTWREAGDRRDTAVLLTLRTQGEETGVTVTETGFDALPAPAERAAASQQGWEVLLTALSDAIDAAVAAGTIELGQPDPAPAAPMEETTVAPGSEEAAEESEGGAASEQRPAEARDRTAPIVLPAAAAAGALELAPEEVDGEVVDAEADAALEVDAEPQLGERLELDTGSLPILDETAGAGPGGGAAAGAADERAEETEAQNTEAEHDEQGAREKDESFTGDPDFDALIRGL